MKASVRIGGTENKIEIEDNVFDVSPGAALVQIEQLARDTFQEYLAKRLDRSDD